MAALDRFHDYLRSFDIDPDEINIQRMTNTGYDAFVTVEGEHGSYVIPIFRPWPPSMDVPYLFGLAIDVINSLDNSDGDNYEI